MRLSFLTPRVERLSADGAFSVLHVGGPLGRLRRTVVLLDRELCAFSLFETAGLPAGRRRQAARLQARLASPYLTSGVALVKAGSDFGIWWWDLTRIQSTITARFGSTAVAVRPETLAQPSGLGWRIVKLERGYEAQLWTTAGLIASAWRRDRFDAQTWPVFARLQRAADPLEVPPAAQTLPLAFDAEAFAFSGSALSREQAVAAGVGGFAVVAGTVAAFLFGQGLSLSGQAEDVAAEAAALRREGAAGGAVAAFESDRRRLAAFREIEERTNPVSAAGAAVGIAAFHDLTPKALDVDGDVLTLTLPYSALEASDDLIAEFEGSGYFYDVQPRTDAAGQSLIMEMKVRDAAPPLSASLPEAG